MVKSGIDHCEFLRFRKGQPLSGSVLLMTSFAYITCFIHGFEMCLETYRGIIPAINIRKLISRGPITGLEEYAPRTIQPIRCRPGAKSLSQLLGPHGSISWIRKGLPSNRGIRPAWFSHTKDAVFDASLPPTGRPLCTCTFIDFNRYGILWACSMQ